jgi:hypothetical protein
MTEDQWLTCTNPLPMLRQLEQLGNADRRLHRRRFRRSSNPAPPFVSRLLPDRRFRLFTCAVCRCGPLPHEWQASALDIAERFANGRVSEDDLRVAARAVWDRAPPPGLLDPIPFTLGSPCGLDGAWNGSHKARLAADPSLISEPYSEELVATDEVGWLHAALLRDIFGNPFRPVTLDRARLTSAVLTLAHGIYADRAFDRLPILADALQDAGCDRADVLDHCRGPGPHARGCWVVDQILGKTCPETGRG